MYKCSEYNASSASTTPRLLDYPPAELRLREDVEGLMRLWRLGNPYARGSILAVSILTAVPSPKRATVSLTAWAIVSREAEGAADEGGMMMRLTEG